MSTKNQDKLSTSKTGWDLAVRDAERKVEAARLRLAEMVSAPVVCKERRDSGEPFPGESVEQPKADVAA